MQLNIRVDSQQVQEMLRLAPKRTTAKLTRILNLVAIETEREMRIKSPVHDGELRRSVKHQVTGLTATIGPTAKYANFVELGTRPHWTSARPGTPLYKWATDKGISPYAVQRSIARRGTKPHPFVAPTVKLMEPRIIGRFEKGIDELTRELGNG